ncbi:MAG TPA: IclR family transcriptional regulator [Microthrixaceae bacterium]|nr:IclR family transcriptional regulator [Microthrixaceae bacterium]
MARMKTGEKAPATTDEAVDAGRRVATIERAADVLFLFAGDRPTLGVTEIASELSISKAVVHRILTSLKDRGLVTSDATTRKYSLGPAVLELAARYRQQLDVRPLAIEAMERLSAATSETATLSIRSGWQRIYVEQVTPPLEVKMSVSLGVSHPLHAGSSSKAFLAFLSQEEQDAFFEDATLTPLTERTVTNPIALRKELVKVREQGYAVSLGERQLGAASVAAPIIEDGRPIAVISVCGPLERFRPKVDQAAELVVAETERISARLGHGPG